MPANIHADISHNVQSTRTDFVDTSDAQNYEDTSVTPPAPTPVMQLSSSHPILWTLIIVLALFLFYRIFKSLTKES